MASTAKQPEDISKKRKASATDASKIIADCTIRNLTFFYVRLSLVTAAPPTKDSQIDALTVKKHFTAAMSQRFGVMGAAVSLDILLLQGQTALIRVPFEDRVMTTEALSSWAGNGLAWRIKESSSWLGGMTGSDGRDLFDD